MENIVNLEINLLYRLSGAMDLILRDCERNMASMGQSFSFERKKYFNDLIKSMANSKRIQEKLEEDVSKVYKNGDLFDLVQGEVNELAYILILFSDRHTVDPEIADRLKAILMDNKSGNNIPENELAYLESRFTLK